MIDIDFRPNFCSPLPASITPYMREIFSSRQSARLSVLQYFDFNLTLIPFYVLKLLI